MRKPVEKEVDAEVVADTEVVKEEAVEVAKSPLIAILDELQESSQFGKEADDLFELFKDKTTVRELMEIEIPDCLVVLQNLKTAIQSAESVNYGRVLRTIAAMPNVAQSYDFI